MKTKKYFIFLAILFIILSFFGTGKSALSQGFPLPLPTPLLGQPVEVDYPEVPGATTPTTVQSTPLVRYAEYVFYFLVWGSGILALLALIYAGFTYITSAGNPDKMRDAKSRIFSALLGLAIVLGSYAILYKINPRFITFELEDVDPLINTIAPGVLVCKAPAPVLAVWVSQDQYIRQNNWTAQLKKYTQETIDIGLKAINKNCYYIESEGPIRPDFDNKLTEMWFIPDVTYSTVRGKKTITESRQYGAAVFDDSDFEGLSAIYASHFLSEIMPMPLQYNLISKEEGHANIKVSSIKPFKRKTPNWVLTGSIQDAPLWQVRLYQEKNENLLFTDNTGKPLPPFMQIPSVGGILVPFPLYFFVYTPASGYTLPHPILTDPDTIDNNPKGTFVAPKSMAVSGEAVVFLFRDSIKGMQTVGDQKGWYLETFYGSDNNLEDNVNIINYKQCPSYATASEIKYCDVATDKLAKTGVTYQCCATAGADGIMVLGGITPL